jgi:hypothetical protein
MSFGTVLRAFRLGYRIPKGRNFLLRMSDNPNGTFNISLAPVTARVPRHQPKEHRAWWEGKDGGTELLKMLPDVWNLKTVKKVIERLTRAVNG